MSALVTRAIAAWAAVLVASSVACIAPPSTPPPAEAARTRSAADGEAIAQDEAHVLEQARESTYRLDRSGLRLVEPDLEAYLLGVGSAALARDRRGCRRA